MIGIVEHNKAVLLQGLELLDRLDDGQYTRPGHHGARGSIGNHIRHCLDFYRCFFRGIDAGRIDYADRLRDDRIASEIPYASEHLLIQVDALERLDQTGHRSLLVRSEDAPDPSDPEAWCRSSVSRELQFLLSHTIHHFALVATLLDGEGVELPEGFGVSPSTLAYWKAAS